MDSPPNHPPTSPSSRRRDAGEAALDVLDALLHHVGGHVFPQVDAGLGEPLVHRALGQAGAHLVLYFFGDQIRRRWRWFDRQCERARLRFGDRLARGTPWLGVTAGLIGLPPTSATAALAPGLRLDPRYLLPIMFLGRVVRFAVVTIIASRV